MFFELADGVCSNGRSSPASHLGVDGSDEATMICSVPFSALKSSSPSIGVLTARASFRQIAAQAVSSQQAKRWRTTSCASKTSFSSLNTRPNTSHRNLLSPVQLRGLHCSSHLRLATESTAFPAHSIMGSIPETTPVVRVFIAGGSYAGLSAAVNLLDLGDGLSPRMAREAYTHHPSVQKVNFQITIADERDGYCKLCQYVCIILSAIRSKETLIRYRSFDWLAIGSGGLGIRKEGLGPVPRPPCSASPQRPIRPRLSVERRLRCQDSNCRR